MPFRVRTFLISGFSLVIALFLLAAFTIVQSVHRVRHIQHELSRLDEAKHQGHLLLSDIAEQYIRQAHSMIIGKADPISYYSQAHDAVLKRIQHLGALTNDLTVLKEVRTIQTTSNEIERFFAENIVPSLSRDKSPPKQNQYDHLEKLTDIARQQVISLNNILGKKSETTQRKLVTILTTTRTTAIITFSLATVISIIVGILSIRMLSRPLVALHRATQRVAGGDLDTRVISAGPLELKAVADGFNDMTVALKALQEKLMLNERMAAIGEISAGVAHELNNPLAVIIGYAGMIRKTCTDPQTLNDLKIISDEANRSKEIIRDLLELSHLPALKPVCADIVPLVKETVERMETVWKNPKVSITVTADTDSVTAFFDNSTIRRVLSNLIRNAYDAAEPAGRIAITIKRQEDGAVISVSDSGPGIDPAFHDNLFKPFKTTKKDGTGLGLAISLAIVKSHGGRIDVGRGRIGGARFDVFLPDAGNNGDNHMNTPSTKDES